MPKMLAAPPEQTPRDVANGFPGPSGKPAALPATLMIQGLIETPAVFAMIGGVIALHLTN